MFHKLIALCLLPLTFIVSAAELEGSGGYVPPPKKCQPREEKNKALFPVARTSGRADQVTHHKLSECYDLTPPQGFAAEKPTGNDYTQRPRPH